MASGDQTITGTSANEHLNGGSGSDTINGGGGNDFINAGSGNDVADGGSGSDRVDGGSGNDILIYRQSENIGATDIYDGGSGIDTIRLELTRAQWLNSALQADIANYLQFLAANTGSNGQAKNTEFRFTAFDLRVSKIENLQIVVDGVIIDPRDQAVAAQNDAIAVSEELPSTSINLLANDSVPDLVSNVVIATQPTLGSVQFTLDLSNVANPQAIVIYTPGAALQSLAAGETATDTFTYTVTDADGDSQTATVTVTITGTNDGPVVVADTNGLDAVVESRRQSRQYAVRWGFLGERQRARERQRRRCQRRVERGRRRRGQRRRSGERQRRNGGDRHLRKPDAQCRWRLELHHQQRRWRHQCPGAGESAFDVFTYTCRTDTAAPQLRR